MSKVSLATRHVMQANKSKNTGPELRVREALRKEGLSGYRLHWKRAAGKPDICYPGRHVAIFVHGCYWHRCPYCALPTPKSNVDFWQAKFDRNKARDQRDREQLLAGGWTVITVWECRLKKDRLAASIRQIAHEVRAARTNSERRPRVVEIGSSPAWKLCVARERMRSARLRRHRYNK